MEARAAPSFHSPFDLARASPQSWTAPGEHNVTIGQAGNLRAERPERPTPSGEPCNPCITVSARPRLSGPAFATPQGRENA
eukprot:365900-Chlamydomonas_euryale.AAC.20